MGGSLGGVERDGPRGGHDRGGDPVSYEVHGYPPWNENRLICLDCPEQPYWGNTGVVVPSQYGQTEAQALEHVRVYGHTVVYEHVSSRLLLPLATKPREVAVRCPG